MQTSANQEETPWHLRRHVCLTGCIILFAILLLCIVFDVLWICDKSDQTQQTNATKGWEFVYISEKIADCKKDRDDFTGSAWLPWLTVLVFPFVMIQFEFTFQTMVGVRDNDEAALELTQPMMNNSSRNRTMGVEKRIAFDTVCGLPVKLSLALTYVMECACVGGFVMLVLYNHQGPYRNRHGAATGILFVAASLLNLQLWWVYSYVAKRPWKGWMVGVIMLAQVAAVISFAVATLQEWSSNVSVGLEYVVAVIWFGTIVLDGFLYWSHRDVLRSPEFKDWVFEAGFMYTQFLLLGSVGVYALLNLVPKV
tara:strand:+ start:5047 stop:5976 length:930 start_codon:yes stop_codon:yes gene_type:complete